MKTQLDIDALVRRSSELSRELSQRCLTSEDVRWGAGIALNGVPENGPLLSRRRLSGWFRRRSGYA